MLGEHIKLSDDRYAPNFVFPLILYVIVLDVFLIKNLSSFCKMLKLMAETHDNSTNYKNIMTYDCKAQDDTLFVCMHILKRCLGA